MESPAVRVQLVATGSLQKACPWYSTVGGTDITTAEQGCVAQLAVATSVPGEGEGEEAGLVSRGAREELLAAQVGEEFVSSDSAGADWSLHSVAGEV